MRASFPNPETQRLHEGAIKFGLALVVLGLVAMVLAGLSHWFALHRLLRGQPPVLTPWPLSITVALLFAIIGLVGLWTLFNQ